MKCIHPTVISDGKGSRRMVPCGRCAWCRKKKRDEWFVRFLSESMKTPCYFLTLTYEDSQIPTRFVDLESGETFIVRGVHDDFVSDILGRVGSVPYLKDWQDFIKRVRKHIDSNATPLKYFFVSEYGHLYGRVHYHALVWCDNDVVSSALVDEWPFGDSVSEPANIGSMKYVTKYILKGSDKKSVDLRDDNIKSNSAAIGANLWPNLIKHYVSDDYESTFRYLGSYHAFPAYFKKKIRQHLDDISDSVAIEIVKDSKGAWKVKNKHCRLVQELDEKRQLPEINENDVVHSLIRLKVQDMPHYYQELYMRDYNKQFEINSKTNLLFNQ